MTDFPNFPDPHVHCASFDSGSTPERIATREVELGTGTLCTTDHGTLASTRLIYRLAQKHKLTPVLGVEGYFRSDDCKILAKYGILPQPENKKPDAPLTTSHYSKYYHLTLHALNQDGFETMVRRLSAANEHAERHGSESKPIWTWDDLEEMGSKNITFGSGCLIGMVGKHLLNGQPKVAIEYYEKLRSIVKPGNFFVELMPHDCSKEWVNGIIIRLRPDASLGIVEDDRKVHQGKMLRIQYDGATEDIRASDLVEKWNGWLKGKKAMPKVELVAVKNYREWKDEGDPVVIDEVKEVADFVPNECHPWCPDGDLQTGVNKFMLRLARKYGDPVLISDDAHYSVPDEKAVQDVRLFSMENDRAKGNAAKWKFYGDYSRQTSQMAFEHFHNTLGIDEAQFGEWVQNNIAWSKRFGWKFSDRKSLPTHFYPKETLEHTISLIKQVGRMDFSDSVRKKRLAAEIKMLHDNGVIDLLPYFFLGQEVCERYEKNGQLTGVGRGSAAGLSLAYYLGITHCDPLRYGLSKERFLTESRIKSGKLPDIDQDLQSHDLLIDPEDPKKGWLQERFAGHVARISTNSTLRLRSTAQDVSRVLHGEVLPEVFQLTKKFPKPPQGINDKDFVFGHKDADGNQVPGAIETDETLKEYARKFPKEWDIVVQALGVCRQKGQHPCGFVITDEPLANFIPTTVLSDGTRITEFVNSTVDPSVEESGGVKMDFLELKTLRDIQGALKLVQQREKYQPKDEHINGLRVPGIRVVPYLRNDGNTDLYDVWDLPEDQSVFRDICMSNTVTVFQFGTSGARQWLENFMSKGEHTLRSIEHISAFTALDRPGPLDASVKEGDIERNMLEEFAARSKGEKPIGNLPILDKLFPETFGVITYQEQVQKAFQVIGETTAEQGDEFRIHISKKKMDAVMKDKAIFMPGAIRTLGESEANRLWNMMETFGQYGFNKSHAVCYAITGYACAWLKHHYPLEWWTSCLRNADRNTIDQKFWVHCRKYIKIPDVRMSQDDFAIEGDSIRAPLRLLTGVGDKAHDELVKGRPYNDIRDFIQRIYDLKVKTGTKVTKVVKKRILKKDQVAGGPTHTETTVSETKLGRSALNKTILLKLIVSGALDSLFPPETDSVFTKMSLFNEIWADVHGIRRKDGTLKVEPPDPRFSNLTPLQSFLLKKSILPSYAEDLAKMASDTGDVIRQDDKYAWLAPKKFEGNKYIPMVTGDVAAAILDGQTPGGFDFPDRFKFGVVAYVSEVNWFWNGQAVRISFEVDGERMQAVKWPNNVVDDDGFKHKEKPELPKGIEGSVSVLTLVRWSAGKSFSIDDVKVVEGTFSLKDEE